MVEIYFLKNLIFTDTAFLKNDSFRVLFFRCREWTGVARIITKAKSMVQGGDVVRRNLLPL